MIYTGDIIMQTYTVALPVAGKSPLPFTEEEAGQAVSTVLTAAASLWAWWKNNSFTQAAIAADELLKKPWQK